MYSYKEFPFDVFNGFKSVKETYGFSLKKVEDDHLVVHENKFCVVSFRCEFGHLEAHISKLDKKKGFNILHLIDFLYPNAVLFQDDFRPYYGSEKAIEWYANALNKYLSHVLKGDFSWIRTFTKRLAYKQKIFELMYTKLDKDHPIRVKFDNNDPTWFTDAEQLYHKEKRFFSR